METPNLFDLQIDGESSGFLKEISRWAKFLSVLGFVMCGLFLLIGLAMMVGASNPLVDASMQGMRYNVVFIGVFYLVCGGISIIPYVYLFQFAVKMKRALGSGEQEALNNSFSNLKSCFKFVGVMTIISMVFFVLAIIAMNFIPLT
ncbi:hypothetical protein GFS24_03540 [Chitinophaga sp. SYP-B3965]|uniref:DUF5362 family protein n=1 Tax=Chitinophaga sp. SYP-B3965 TaxID=2663120 RepID=UPI001299D638|nr:DUF5362 family protein [Chitinophaga sp. SYP-B3965]MRG44169.1 hypothetical protein [Chitinophaga sp. SYP-B3965]